MVPWSIRREMDLPPNAKYHEMQQNLHRLVQFIRAAMSDDQSISPTQEATQFVDCESISPTQQGTETCGL